MLPPPDRTEGSLCQLVGASSPESSGGNQERGTCEQPGSTSTPHPHHVAPCAVVGCHSVPRSIGRQEAVASPALTSRWVAPHQPAVETEITSSNYGRIWKLFVPPTFPPAQELISPLLSPLGPGCGAPGPWCSRKLFLIVNYCPLELMVALNHRTLIWGVLSHWNGLPSTSSPTWV